MCIHLLKLFLFDFANVTFGVLSFFFSVLFFIQFAVEENIEKSPTV